jgi:hypothetical protein
MALVQPTRILQTGGLVVIDGLPLIPEIGELFPKTLRWHAEKLRPCPGPAAWRRHQRRGEPICDPCKAWRADWDASRSRDSRDGRTRHKEEAGRIPFTGCPPAG